VQRQRCASSDGQAVCTHTGRLYLENWVLEFSAGLCLAELVDANDRKPEAESGKDHSRNECRKKVIRSSAALQPKVNYGGTAKNVSIACSSLQRVHDAEPLLLIETHCTWETSAARTIRSSSPSPVAK
jgi:hypothetical protein